MQLTNLLAVASSVSMDRGFDTLAGIAYAIDNGFKGFQAFINQQITTDPESRRMIRSICKDNHLALIAHAPATLNWINISDDSVSSVAKDLLASENKALVVHHYDETVSLEEVLKCLQYLHDKGITICLENFFMLGKETSQNCFRAYLSLLTRAKTLGITPIPVFDVPRLYDPEVNLSQMALQLIKEAFDTFESLETPIILHLIDAYSDSLERSTWCPIGQGIIPYVDIFRQLNQREISIQMTVLEFEDRVNPIESRRFLEDYLIN